MGNTKKVGSTGRFKARYGVGVKKRVLEVENRVKNKAPCPFCGFDRSKRIAAGLFICTKCNAKYTGGAYEAQTLVGKAINKMVSQKAFIETANELIKAKESSFSDIEREVEQALMGPKLTEELPKKKRKAAVISKESEESKDTEQAG
ncbi:MAG: 50S ribosomal protein L37ae [Candidatus Diapherotrites archaeon]|nr:50S ribosomal protein L37ae [Candidatus Diapherotrites archaeon]